METIVGFDFFALTFVDDGKVTAASDVKNLVSHARATSATDAILIAHGFRNDTNDATGVYTRFLTTLRDHLGGAPFQGPLGSRRFIVGGIYWPSKPFREAFGDEEEGTRTLRGPETMRAEIIEQLDDMKKNDASPKQRRNLDKAIALVPKLENNRGAQDKFVSLVLSVLDDDGFDETEGLDDIRSQAGSELLARIADDQRGIGDALGSIFGRVGRFLNLTTWYLMKKRSGTVGATGVAEVVRQLKMEVPSMKVHLVGHSLGGRLMAACAKSLSNDPLVQADSLTLLEAAFSHYGFSPDNGKGSRGFFREVIERQVVKGPFLSTFSQEDTVVGRVYAIASRLARDRTRELGDANDPFGGIGRNGSQKTPEAVSGKLLTPGGAYSFTPGVLTNLDGSGGLIKDHSDVTNAAVTYAFASALSLT
jgi:hypothetical protein